MNAEGRRLVAARTQEAPWRKWGPYLSERQWGTVREDYSDERRRLELFQPRPGPLARLSLGRRRHRRHLRRPADALLRARALERQGSDPQGTPVRPDQQRGQPRRGREGVLLLPRQHADALVHEVPLQVPAGARSRTTTWSRPTGGAAATEPEYELLDTGVFDDDRYFDVFVEYAKASPEDLLIQITASQPRARSRRRCTSCRRSGSATPGRGHGGRAAGPASQMPRRRRRGRRGRRSRRWASTLPATASGGAELLFTENETNTRARSSACRTATPVREGRHQRLRRSRPDGRGQSRARRERRRPRTTR